MLKTFDYFTEFYGMAGEVASLLISRMAVLILYLTAIGREPPRYPSRTSAPHVMPQTSPSCPHSAKPNRIPARLLVSLTWDQIKAFKIILVYFAKTRILTPCSARRAEKRVRL